MRQFEKNERFAVYCDAQRIGNPIDVHAEIAKKNIVVSSSKIITMKKSSNIVTANKVEEKLDIGTWLPFAAPKYKISPNVDDYIFVPVFTIPSDLPNRNGVAFPLKSLLEFNTERGCQGYKTFKGMPVQFDHANTDITKAYGVIADSFLKPLKGYGNGKVWKVMLLLAIDRTKDVVVSKKICEGEYNSYSMGAWVDKYSCSFCGADVGKCEHIPHNSPLCFYEKDGKVVFKNMHGISGFETSIVPITPAWPMATTDHIMM